VCLRKKLPPATLDVAYFGAVESQINSGQPLVSPTRASAPGHRGQQTLYHSCMKRQVILFRSYDYFCALKRPERTNTEG
jgi:hypothetical protein